MREKGFSYHKIKRALKLYLYRRSSASNFSFIHRKILSLCGTQVCALKKIEDIANRSFSYAESCEFEVSAPKFFPCSTSNRYKGKYPELKAHVVENALVNTHASQIVADDNLIISDYRLKNRNKIPAISSKIAYYERDFCVCHPKPDRIIDEGIFIDGDGSFNWFHFVVECLPKAFAATTLADEFKNYPLIAPKAYSKVKTFREALDLFADNRQVIVLEKNQPTKVGSLLYLDDISSSPYNLMPGIWPTLHDYCHHDRFLKNFAAEFKKRLGILEKKPDFKRNRIFLVRSEKRRSYNQDELLARATKYGFNAVSPENMSLKEQAELFNEAEIVVGASGAAWTNLLFMNPSAKGLTWLPPQYAQFCSYSSLANILGQKLTFVSAQPLEEIKSTASAYTANYVVDPIKFEAALIHIIENV